LKEQVSSEASFRRREAAHRAATRHPEIPRTLVMDCWKIVQRGTHDRLLAQNGLYAQLYETQFKRERV
jgi:ABC-type multidrug transport system fused ATPase/permease subunit